MADHPLPQTPAMRAQATFGIDPQTGLPAALPSVDTPHAVAAIGSPSMAAAHETVGTTPTLIVAARAGRRSVTLGQLGIVSVFLGGSGVSATSGLLLAGTAGATISLPTQAAIYGIVAVGAQAVSYVEFY